MTRDRRLYYGRDSSQPSASAGRRPNTEVDKPREATGLPTTATSQLLGDVQAPQENKITDGKVRLEVRGGFSSDTQQFY